MLLGDRLYGVVAFARLAQVTCHAVGSHFLLRASRAVKPRVIKRLRDGSRLVGLAVRAPRSPSRIIEWIEVREIRVQVGRTGQRAHELRLWRLVDIEFPKGIGFRTGAPSPRTARCAACPTTDVIRPNVAALLSAAPGCRVEVVGQVDRFVAQLDAMAGAEVERAHERLVPLPEAGSAQHVERRVAERAGRRLAERRDVEVAGQRVAIPVRIDTGTTFGRWVGALSVKPFSAGSPPAMTLIGPPLRICSTLDAVQFDTSAPSTPPNSGVRNTDVRLKR